MEVLYNVGFSHDSPHNQYPGLLHAILAYACFLLAYEFFQLISQGFEYFKSPTNLYDIAADTTIIAYCINKFTIPYPWVKEDEEYL